MANKKKITVGPEEDKAENTQKQEITEIQERQEEPLAEDVQEERIEENAEQQAQELNDKLMRMAAEYDNYRKRTNKEKTEMYSNAKAQTITEFLSVLDNLERALNAETEDSTLKQGIQMVVDQFHAVFDKLNVKEIPALNEKFNPDFHNAVKQIKDKNFGDNMVCEVYEKGYQLNDKILRHAIVVVANP